MRILDKIRTLSVAAKKVLRGRRQTEKHLCRDCAKVSDWGQWFECRFRYPGHRFYPARSPIRCDRFEPAPHTLMPDYDSMEEVENEIG